MYAGSMYAWEWLKQLAQMNEQKFRKSTKSMDSIHKEDHRRSYDLQWTFSDLVLVTTCFQIDIIYLCNMGYMLKDNQHPGFLQIMIMYITWGPALIYMEIFLGQYVQRGCLYLKNMSPLTCSTIGYAMLSMTYCYSVATVGRLADSYMFFFRSFSSELPWMVCPKDSTPATCIDRALLVNCYLENKQDNCYSKLGPELLSTRIYYKATHSPLANRTALLLFGWFTIYIALKRTLGDTRILVKRLLLFMLVLFLCLLTPLMVHVSRGLSVVPFFTVRHGAVVSIETWIAAFKSFLRDHAVVRGGWQLIGSHIKRGPAAANLTIYTCALTYMVTVISQIFSTGILGVLFFYMKITHVEEELYFPKYAKLFNFYPFALGMLPVRHVWSLIFFALVAISSMSYTIVNMVILEESMYDNFPVLMRYRSYVKVILCIFGFIIGAVTNLLTGPDSYEDDVVLLIASQLTQVVVLILTFSIGYIYGIERFSDDMNFLNGSQPTTYWKICWMTLPFGILILIGGDMIAIKFPRNNLAEMSSDIAYVVLLGLAILRVLYQIGMSIKARNVTGILFQATPLWGPPLPEDRRLRNTYNPREETKYWRRNTICTHHCLLNKDIIHSIIFREVDSRTSEARNSDTLQPDFTTIPEQLKQNQVAIAIDKVSIAQLETFEHQVEQKVKTLKQMEEAEINSHHGQAMVQKKRIKITKSMEQLNGQINRKIKPAQRKTRLETAHDLTQVQRTTTKTNQRQVPIFAPEKTQRPVKTWKAPVLADRKSKKDTNPTKVHTYAVQVPQLILLPSNEVRQNSTSPKSVLKKVNLKVVESSSSHEVPIPKSETSKALQRQVVHELKRLPQKSRLPVWPLPLNTLRPTVSRGLTRSSSSTSTGSREPYRQLSAYFLNMLLPPKTDLCLPTCSVCLHSLPKSSKCPENSTASLELSALNHDLILGEILRSVLPRQVPASHCDTSEASFRTYATGEDAFETRKREVFRPPPVSRTSIARRSPSIDSPVRSACSHRPLLRKQSPMGSAVPLQLPRPIKIKTTPCQSAFEREAVWPNAGKEIPGSSASYENIRTSPKTRSKEAEVSAVDIDQAIQIRIDNLLRGVRDPGQSTYRRPGCLSAAGTVENDSTRAMKQHEVSTMSSPGKGASPAASYLSTTKKRLSDQLWASSSVMTKISALGNKFTKTTRTSASLRLHRILQATDVNDKRLEITIEEKNADETKPDLSLTSCEDAEQPSSSVEHEGKGWDDQEQADRKD